MKGPVLATTAAFLLTACANVQHPASQPTIAVTIDDLPVHGEIPRGETPVSVARDVIAALKAENVEAYGFVNGYWTEKDPATTDLLTLGRAAGQHGAFTGAGDRRLGKFELASGGTVFLDEIGELPLAVQGKLLRVIEEKVVDRIGGRAPVPVDVRVVAATNKNLKAAVDNGEFRGDLFFRLAVFPVEIPPLRERDSDVLMLGKHFAAELGKELRGREASLSDNARAALRGHRWPGNVRELENAIERACILSDSLILEPVDLGLVTRSDADQTPTSFDLTGTLSEVAQRALRFVEQRKISAALKNKNGNKNQVAEELGISYKTLLTKLKDYNL